ncbi:MAG: TonB-dependent receptor [Verrucomicrobiota bacterium]
MKSKFILGCVGFPAMLWAQAPAPASLPEVTVYSPRVANQAPAGTFAMPVSALRYEPRVDIHARNLAEGQADITIRGGIFENTGFQVGAITLGDSQTGHYLAEIPVAPAMLSAPTILTGADLAQGAMNATAGSIAYGWRPIRTAGAVSAGFGENALVRGELYQGVSQTLASGWRLGADVAVAHSDSDGPIANGEHEFNRINGRVQLATVRTQTDFFAGYQAKFFGWPNLYTPFNSNETDDLETTLFSLNHRVDLGAGDFLAAGVYHRRNKDDYAFNRFAPIVGPVHPFQHTTWVTGAALDGRRDFGALALNFRAEASSDELKSTSLTSGKFREREFTRLVLIPEKTWATADGGNVRVKAGAAYDDTNRDGSAVSPVFEIARTLPSAVVRRVYASFTETSQLPTYTALNSSTTGGLFRGNPNLGRQTTRNYEIGFAGTVGGWTTEAALFWRQDEALVDWTFARGVTARTANAVDIEVGGVELVARRSFGAADLVLGYTGLTKDEDYRGAAVDASFYALNYAKHRLTAALTWRVGAGFEVRFDNVARIQADNLLRVVGGDKAVTSAIGVAYRPPAWRRFEIAVQVENLWDTDFQEVPAVPASPRQVSMGVAYAW